MSKTACPFGCGKKFINEYHAKRHGEVMHKNDSQHKQKGWATPYGFVDFKEPVTYEEALEVSKFFRQMQNARCVHQQTCATPPDDVQQ